MMHVRGLFLMRQRRHLGLFVDFFPTEIFETLDALAPIYRFFLASVKVVSCALRCVLFQVNISVLLDRRFWL